MDPEAALDAPLTELAGALRSGQVRAEALAEAALHRAEASRLGGYRVLRRASAVAEAQAADAALACGRDPGPLAGLPVSVKDLFGLPGERTYAGTPRALPARFEAAGPVLGQALRQMCVVTGKTHTVEFAFGGIGSNPHWGTPRNPHAESEHRVPGGSSSGAGTSLYEGSARIAFGTDTAGSVRIPAAWTGQVGLKTTKDRWSTEGIVPLSTTLDTPGILTRTVADAIFAFGALDPDRGGEPGPGWGRSLRGLRIGFLTGLFREDCSPGVLEALERALQKLESAGALVRDASLPGTAAAKALFDVGGPTAAELQRFLRDELPDWLEGLDAHVAGRLRAAGEIPAVEYLSRLHRLRDAQRQARSGFEQFDVFVSPTVALTPPKLSEVEGAEQYRRANLLTLRNPGMISYLGLCALSLPCGVDALGMPVGLQLIGAPHAEKDVLGWGLSAEGALRT